LTGVGPESGRIGAGINMMMQAFTSKTENGLKHAGTFVFWIVATLSLDPFSTLVELDTFVFDY
jgi:hypothetical protein